jgi:ADP-heptose:LPS heptosyltransferase
MGVDYVIILIQPFSARLRSGNQNPKNYPILRWRQVLSHLALQGDHVIQVGMEGEERLTKDCRFNLPLKEIEVLLQTAGCFIGVDSFLQHLAYSVGRRGIVLWSVSDPVIFGHPEHLNLLKGREYLRPFQYQTWEEILYSDKAFVTAESVIKAVDEFRAAPSGLLLTKRLALV